MGHYRLPRSGRETRFDEGEKSGPPRPFGLLRVKRRALRGTCGRESAKSRKGCQRYRVPAGRLDPSEKCELGDGDDCGMEFPQRCHLRGATVVVKVFKSHTQDLYWQGLRQFTAVLGVELKAMFGQLGLRSLAGTAKFTVHGSFHNDPGSVLIGGHGDFEVHIAVRRIHARYLEKCSRHMEHLKLSARSRRVGEDDGVLRPTENGVHTNFLGGNVGNRDVFRQMAEISNVRFNRQAFAKILGTRLDNTEAAAVAADTKQRE
jgi:hypothetical protein